MCACLHTHETRVTPETEAHKGPYVCVCDLKSCIPWPCVRVKEKPDAMYYRARVYWPQVNHRNNHNNSKPQLETHNRAYTVLCLAVLCNALCRVCYQSMKEEICRVASVRRRRKLVIQHRETHDKHECRQKGCFPDTLRSYGVRSKE